MFSTALGKSRQESIQRHVLLYIEKKKIVECGGKENNFTIERRMQVDSPEDNYRVTCKECGVWFEQVVCDWSRDFDLDGFIKTVLYFEKNHRHGPQPVLDVAGSFPPALVEYPKGYRKFREV